MDLRNRTVDVGHVLEHLHRQQRVERLIRDRQTRRVSSMERHVFAALRAFGGHREHRWSAVDPSNRSLRPNLFGQFRQIETGTAPDVHYIVTRLGIECIHDQATTTDDVATPVHGL